MLTLLCVTRNERENKQITQCCCYEVLNDGINYRYYGIRFDRNGSQLCFHIIAVIADDRTAANRTWFYFLRSIAIVCDHMEIRLCVLCFCGFQYYLGRNPFKQNFRGYNISWGRMDRDGNRSRSSPLSACLLKSAAILSNTLFFVFACPIRPLNWR